MRAVAYKLGETKKAEWFYRARDDDWDWFFSAWLSGGRHVPYKKIQVRYDNGQLCTFRRIHKQETER